MARLSEPDLKGHLEFLDLALVIARTMAWGKAPMEKLADLLDAIHNVPSRVAEGLGVDEKGVRMFFEHYDAKWGPGTSAHPGPSLVAMFRDSMAKHRVDPGSGS